MKVLRNYESSQRLQYFRRCNISGDINLNPANTDAKSPRSYALDLTEYCNGVAKTTLAETTSQSLIIRITTADK